MKTETITLTKIIASDEMILTNGEIYGEEIFLGSSDSIDSYYEITMAEYTEILKGGETEY